MNINHHNYESYFIDYIDGVLTLEEVNELDAFLLLNDELREQLELLSEVKLQASNIVYHQKKRLKKEELHECPDYYPIATVEHSLTILDKDFLCKYPVNKKDINLYQKVKLNYDSRILCPNKKQLYRRSKPFIAILQHYISAAIVILLVGLTYLFYTQQAEKIEISMAQTIIIPCDQGIKSAQMVFSFALKECRRPLNKPRSQKRIELSRIEIHGLPIIELSSIKPDYSLILQNHRSISIKQPEMYLTEAAHTWKGDRVDFLSDNIISSIQDTGKAITQRLKIIYIINNNRDDYASY